MWRRAGCGQNCGQTAIRVLPSRAESAHFVRRGGIRTHGDPKATAVFKFDGPRSGVCARVQTFGFIRLSVRAGAGVFGPVTAGCGTGCGTAHAFAPMTASMAGAGPRGAAGRSARERDAEAIWGPVRDGLLKLLQGSSGGGASDSVPLLRDGDDERMIWQSNGK